MPGRKRFVSLILLIMILSVAAGNCENIGIYDNVETFEEGEILENPWVLYDYPGDPLELNMPRMSYWIYTPENMRPGLPLVVYLHSSYGMIEATKDALPALITDGTIENPDAVVLVPQHPSENFEEEWYNCLRSVDAIVEEVIKKYEIDTSRISLAGFSLGGIGVFDLAYMAPERYKRILSICGKVYYYIHTEDPESLKNCEIKAIIGKNDKAVNPTTVIAYIKTLISLGAKASLEEYDMSHMEIPQVVFRDKEIQEWLWLVPSEDGVSQENNQKNGRNFQQQK